MYETYDSSTMYFTRTVKIGDKKIIQDVLSLSFFIFSKCNLFPWKYTANLSTVLSTFRPIFSADYGAYDVGAQVPASIDCRSIDRSEDRSENCKGQGNDTSGQVDI